MGDPTSNGTKLPVFPFNDMQVGEVADALSEKLHWLQDDERAEELARTALKAAARMMRMESEPDPMGYPSGYGYRTIWAVTPRSVVKPDGSWERLDA